MIPQSSFGQLSFEIRFTCWYNSPLHARQITTHYVVLAPKPSTNSKHFEWGSFNFELDADQAKRIVAARTWTKTTLQSNFDRVDLLADWRNGNPPQWREKSLAKGPWVQRHTTAPLKIAQAIAWRHNGKNAAVLRVGFGTQCNRRNGHRKPRYI